MSATDGTTTTRVSSLKNLDSSSFTPLRRTRKTRRRGVCRLRRSPKSRNHPRWFLSTLFLWFCSSKKSSSILRVIIIIIRLGLSFVRRVRLVR